MAAGLVAGHAGFGKGLTLPLINQVALLQGPLAVELALLAAHGAGVSGQSVCPISLAWGDAKREPQRPYSREHMR